MSAEHLKQSVGWNSKKQRQCLNCGRWFNTEIEIRTCTPCKKGVNNLAGGLTVQNELGDLDSGVDDDERD